MNLKKIKSPILFKKIKKLIFLKKIKIKMIKKNEDLEFKIYKVYLRFLKIFKNLIILN